MKKGQNISINVIVVAVIALLVLVVLMAIFGGRMGLWGENLDEVQDKKCSDIDGYRIKSYGESCGEGFTQSNAAYDDIRAGQKCCVPVSTS